ncbi:MAG TPA: nucleoside-diphosphate kinase [Planctomycetota bacterium]|nr:nucleoside-diphosphate kinase [Planctomycetota bacterium]
MDTTLVLVKPDGVQRRLVGRILARFEEKGLQVTGLKLALLPRSLLERHYGAHKGKPFYEGLVTYMASSPVVAIALRGRNAVAVVRKMMGATFGSKAEPGTIRGDFAISDGFNLVHGSDSPESAEKEVALFFAVGEVLDWKPGDQNWVYDSSDGVR